MALTRSFRELVIASALTAALVAIGEHPGIGHKNEITWRRTVGANVPTLFAALNLLDLP
jgi:hypothetical protein